MRIFLKVVLLLFSFNLVFALTYEVKFIGLTDKEIISAIKSSANIFLLQDRPPRTVNALRYRIETDLPGIVKTFQAYGYFDATVNYDLEEETRTVQVFIFCDPGPRYVLHEYKICLAPCENPEICKKYEIEVEKLGLILEEGTNSKKLIEARNNLLTYLGNNGYPLAKIQRYEIQADGIRKIINVKICIDPGPYSNFGPISVFGLKDVDPRFILKKIDWKEGEMYSPQKIKDTQTRLSETGLFSSVSITHGEVKDSENSLPIKIHVIESNHQNIAIGVNYATVDGPGGMFSYTNYNIGNMGEIVNIHAEFAKRALTGFITYKKPDFRWFDQDLVMSAYAVRERIIPYHAFTYGAVSKIIHRVTKQFQYSYGIKGEQIDVSNSANNGRFILIGAPFSLRFDNSNHLLNPTRGFGLIYTFTPYSNIYHNGDPFLKQTITTLFYVPVRANEKIVFATRIQLGSIVGQSVYDIPMTKLFLGGCEDDLRGYKYKTVGPRNSNGDIIGGRSAIYFTFEPRLRITKNFGVVPFFDMGNIQLCSYPTIHGKWRKDVGIGIRYFTFIGPLRLDVAFPLNKYKSSDPNYKFYASIGQTF